MYSIGEINFFKEKEFYRREEKLKKLVPQKLRKTNNLKEKLHIVYVMTWTGVCGGSKIILEHANRLTKKGHKVTLISHDEKPSWFKLNSSVDFIQVPWEEILGEQIPKCDVIVATYWREIYECIEQKIAPVVYFEQGDYHLFDMNKMENRVLNYIKKQFEAVKFVYTVSNYAKQELNNIYKKEAIVIPNAISKKIFYSTEKDTSSDKINIALIGSENVEFKRISIILKALELLKNEGYKIEIDWITPDKPKENNLDAIINPEQKVIGDILRKADIYICASLYESFCLPVLEAMACGAAVITTNNGGNMDFVKANYNALLIEKDNIEDICEKVKLLIKDKDFRESLQNNAIQTSKSFSWEKTIKLLEDYYKNIASYEIEE